MNEMHTRRIARAMRGFTLMELMIVVVIGGILAGVAIASYFNQVNKSRRADAKNALLDLAARQERFFTTNNSYTNVAANLGYAALPASVPGGTSTTTYTLTVTAATATTFTAQASRTGPQATDDCGDYTITDRGIQANVNNTLASAQCW
jgi:type IV pilus assembly protein PilE